MRTPWRVLAGGAAGALLLLAAACGGSSDSGSGSGSGSGSASSSSSDSASASPSASASADSSSDAGGSSGAVLTKSDIFTRLLAAQKKAGSYTFTLSIGTAARASTGKGEADTSTTPPATHVTLGIAGQQLETISAGGIFYLKGGPFGTAKWLKVDPKSSSGLGAVLSQLGTSDPQSALGALQDAATVTKGGSSSVDGVATTEYDVSVPSSALVKNAPGTAGLLPKTISYQLFVDKDDLLRRLTSSYPIQGQTSTTRIDYTGYGSKVSISAPPASQVTDKLGG